MIKVVDASSGVLVVSCGYASSLGSIIGVWVHEDEGSRSRKQGSDGCWCDRDSSIGEDFGKSVLQNFTPDYKKHIGLGGLGTSIICSKWHTPITCLHMWQQDPISKLLV